MTAIRPVLLSLAAILLACSPFHTAFAQQTVGDGGDPIELLFLKAKVDAVTVAESFSPDEEARAKFDSDVWEFLLENDRYLRMPQDIAESPHEFLEDADGTLQSKCAFTNLPGKDRQLIRFSLSKCRQTLQPDDTSLATRILLHEATHHFGLTSHPDDEDHQEVENKAWRIADQLYEHWQWQRERRRPSWGRLAPRGAPDERFLAASTIIGPQSLLIWGGCRDSRLPDPEACQDFLSDGAILEVDENRSRWRSINHHDAPSGRKLPSATLLQNPVAKSQGKVLIWGGCSGPHAGCQDFHNDGGLYDPETDSWQKVSPGPLSGRINHTARWTGDQVLLFGGEDSRGHPLADLWSYRPDRPTRWQRLSETEEGRTGHTAIWTGRQLVVWGGCSKVGLIRCQSLHRDGFAFDPSTEQSYKLPEPPEDFAPRWKHSAVWTGRWMIVWGGRQGHNQPLSDGAVLDLSKEPAQWSLVDSLLPWGEEKGRFGHQAHWTGTSMLVYGGQSRSRSFASQALRLDFIADRPSPSSWHLISTTDGPVARKGHVQHWLDDRLVIWGGFSGDRTFLSTGAQLLRAHER